MSDNPWTEPTGRHAEEVLDESRAVDELKAAMNDLIVIGHTKCLSVLDAIDKIEALVLRGREKYDSDETIRDSIIRKLEIIGEAVKYISIELKKKNPHIQWKRLAGMRDVLIHQYFGVDINVIWDVANKRIPELKSKLRAIAEDIGDPE